MLLSHLLIIDSKLKQVCLVIHHLLSQSLLCPFFYGGRKLLFFPMTLKKQVYFQLFPPLSSSSSFPNCFSSPSVVLSSSITMVSSNNLGIIYGFMATGSKQIIGNQISCLILIFSFFYLNYFCELVHQNKLLISMVYMLISLGYGLDLVCTIIFFI